MKNSMLMNLIKYKKVVTICAVITALSFYVLHIFFCFFYYPGQWVKMLYILIFLIVGIIPAFLVLPKMDEKYLVPISFALTLIASFVITLTCLFTGGFASIFFLAQMGVVIISSVLYFMTPKQYAVLVLICMLQHHIILFFVPWKVRDLIINLSILIPYAVTMVIIHHIMNYFRKQTKALLGYLPICANCKKIRDDQGAWNQIESYVSERTEANFTQSVCPECAKKNRVIT